jgi:hypothetical protein
MMKRKLTLAILFLSLIYSGCKKDNKTVIIPKPGTHLVSKFTKSEALDGGRHIIASTVVNYAYENNRLVAFNVNGYNPNDSFHEERKRELINPFLEMETITIKSSSGSNSFEYIREYDEQTGFLMKIRTTNSDWVQDYWYEFDSSGYLKSRSIYNPNSKKGTLYTYQDRELQSIKTYEVDPIGEVIYTSKKVSGIHFFNQNFFYPYPTVEALDLSNEQLYTKYYVEEDGIEDQFYAANSGFIENRTSVDKDLDYTTTRNYYYQKTQ